jgi:hypothetical protein
VRILQFQTLMFIFQTNVCNDHQRVYRLKTHLQTHSPELANGKDRFTALNLLMAKTGFKTLRPFNTQPHAIAPLQVPQPVQPALLARTRTQQQEQEVIF